MGDAHQYQKRFWDELNQLKAQVEYVHLYHVDSEKRDNNINIFLAIASNGSIAAWAIWSEIQIIWAVVIAASQLITAIKPFLPFGQRAKKLSEASASLERLLLTNENRWYPISEGEVSNDEINASILRLKKDKLDITDKYLRSVSLPDKPELMDRASEEARIYFETLYHGDSINEQKEVCQSTTNAEGVKAEQRERTI